MAKSKTGGPGTYSEGGVVCTMDSPFKTKGGMPSSSMGGDWSGGSRGAGAIPTRVTDNLGGMASGAPNQVAPSQQGQKRDGTREYPQGGGGMRDGRSKGRP